MKIVAMIQARLGSSRFNSKILQMIYGKSVLQHVYERVKKAKRINDVYVIIPDNEEILKSYCYINDIRCLVGEHENVLKRYYDCNQLVKADHIVRITSDNPIIDPKVIDQLIKQHLKQKNDYTSNNFFGKEEFPDGLDCEIMTKDTLNYLMVTAKEPKYIQHVTTYVRENLDKFKYGILKNKYGNYSNLRLTLDNIEDLKLLKLVFSRLYFNNPYFGNKEIIQLYKKEPGLFDMNKMYKRNEGWNNV